MVCQKTLGEISIRIHMRCKACLMRKHQEEIYSKAWQVGVFGDVEVADILSVSQGERRSGKNGFLSQCLRFGEVEAALLWAYTMGPTGCVRAVLALPYWDAGTEPEDKLQKAMPPVMGGGIVYLWYLWRM